MAYDFLGLTNDICRRLNETELTSAQFPTATGVYSQIKDSVNAAVRDINQSHFQWPFNHNFDTIIMTAGQLRYPLPANAKYIDFDTVRLQRSTTPLVESARRLTQLSYDEYVSQFIIERPLKMRLVYVTYSSIYRILYLRINPCSRRKLCRR